MGRKFEYHTGTIFGEPEVTSLRIYEPLCDVDISEIRQSKYDVLQLFLDSYDSLALPKLNPAIRGLTLQSALTLDVSWISDLEQLKWLNVRGKLKGHIDFERLKSLEWCIFPDSKAVNGLFEGKAKFNKLHTLSLLRANHQLDEFSSSLASRLTCLGLTGGSLKSLSGIEKFSKLRSLSLMDMRQLEDASQAKSCSRLEILDITACSKISSFGWASELLKLKTLVVENKSIRSLREFLPGEKIEVIRLGDRTLIEDLDTSVFLEFPKLSLAIFGKKKGYEHNALEISEFLQAKSQ